MPQLDHSGPQGKGPKTGRKLGKCRKTDVELRQMGQIGTGQAKRRHSGGGDGYGKRTKYDQNKTE